MNRPNFSQRPASSITFISPQKKVITPIRPIASSTAESANAKRLSCTSEIEPVQIPATTEMPMSVTHM